MKATRKMQLLSYGFVNQLPVALSAIRRRGGLVSRVLQVELNDKGLLMFVQFSAKVDDTLTESYGLSLSEEVAVESRRALASQWNPFHTEGVEFPEQDRYELGQGLPTLDARVYLSPTTDALVPLHADLWVRSDSTTLLGVLDHARSEDLHLESLALSQEEVAPGYYELSMRCWAPRFDSMLPDRLRSLSGVLYARVQSDSDLVESWTTNAVKGGVLSPMIARDLESLDVALLLDDDVLLGVP